MRRNCSDRLSDLALLDPDFVHFPGIHRPPLLRACAISKRRAAEKSDHRHRRLLRARRERPRRCRTAAKQDDEIAPSYT
jgi:hypothetical protein